MAGRGHDLLHLCREHGHGQRHPAGGGRALPFISYGGTAMVTLGLALGMLMSVRGRSGNCPAVMGIFPMREDPLDCDALEKKLQSLMHKL
jgi:hypothetical protein